MTTKRAIKIKSNSKLLQFYLLLILFSTVIGLVFSSSFSLAQSAVKDSSSEEIKNEDIDSNNLRDLIKEVRENPSVENLLDLSLAYYKAGKYNQTIEVSQKVIKDFGLNASASNNICVANISLKNYDLAIAACEEALKIDPNFSLAKNNLAWAKQEQELE